MERKNEIAVGLVFIFGIAVVAYFTIIKRDLFSTRDYYYMTVNFQNVEGIVVGDKVKVNGVVSGNIDKIALADAIVSVRLRLFNDFAMFENYRITIQNETALGGKYISIFPGSKYIDNVMQQEIYSRENLKGFSTGDPLSMLSEILAYNRENINATVRNIRDFTANLNSESLKSALKNIRDITDKINTGKGTLGQLVNDKNIGTNADELIKDLKEAIEDNREQAPVTSFIRAALTVF